MTHDTASRAQIQHTLFHEIYVLLDDGDRRTLADAALTPLEFAVLQRLDTATGRRLTDVCAELLCVKSTITRVVDRLESAGLVQRMPDPEDRRAQRVTLTAAGVAVCDRALQLHHASIVRRFNSLDEHEQSILIQLLEKLRSGLTQQLEKA
jgi:MarR family transcriptional regulator, 2-MHQ and catechol-resistance regulon repressor